MSIINYDRRLALHLLKPSIDDYILDCGCGNGDFALQIARTGARVFALDLSICNTGGCSLNHSSNLEFHFGDITKMSRDWNQLFNKILCHYVLEHISSEQVPMAFAEMRRVLRPEGDLILTVPIHDDWIHRRFISRITTRKAWSTKGHLVSYSVDQIKALADTYGFNILQTFTTSYMGIPTVAPLATRATFRLTRRSECH